MTSVLPSPIPSSTTTEETQQPTSLWNAIKINDPYVKPKILNSIIAMSILCPSKVSHVLIEERFKSHAVQRRLYQLSSKVEEQLFAADGYSGNKKTSPEDYQQAITIVNERLHSLTEMKQQEIYGDPMIQELMNRCSIDGEQAVNVFLRLRYSKERPINILKNSDTYGIQQSTMGSYHRMELYKAIRQGSMTFIKGGDIEDVGNAESLLSCIFKAII